MPMLLATFQNGFRDKTTPTLTTPLVRANMSCAVATIFPSLDFLSLSFLCGQTEQFGSCNILQSCSSFFFCLHGQPELFAIDRILQFLSTHYRHLVSIFESGRALWFSVFVCSRLILSLSIL